MKQTKLKGQTILEILLAVMLVTITFVGLYSLSNNTIRQTSYSRNLSLANTYSFELGDWLKSAKNQYGWEAIATKFANDSGASNSVTYCLNTLPQIATEFEALSPGVCAEDEFIANTIYQRSATIDLSNLANKSLLITINTTWPDNTNPASSQVITINKTE